MSCCFYRITNWSVPKHVLSVCHGNLQTASRTKWIFIVICWGFNYGVYWYYDIFIKHARVFPLSLHLFITVSDCTRTGCRSSNQEVLRKWHFEMVLIPFSLVLFSTGKTLLVYLHQDRMSKFLLPVLIDNSLCYLFSVGFRDRRFPALCSYGPSGGRAGLVQHRSQ